MRNGLYRFSRMAMLLSALAVMTGCAEFAAGTIKCVESPILEKETVIIPPVEVEPPPSAEYLIGPGDVLAINANRPEFSMAASIYQGRVLGSRVDGSGNVHLPLVGTIHVAGLTVTQAEARIKEPLRVYLKEPWVVVEIVEHRSHPLYLLGQFKHAGTSYMERPLNLIQGIALGNGFESTANLRGARLTRADKLIPVDIHELIAKGDQRQNIWLKDGDAIYVPDSKSQQVFVFGAVKKPGVITMPTDGLNVAQAIAAADLRNSGYDLGHVRIIRSLSTTRGELIVVDLERIMRGEALPFQLMPGDIVYIPKSAMGDWNDAINDILPSLQAMSAILQPFVQLKFLSE